MPDDIQLLQFFICREFETQAQDRYSAAGIHSNIYASEFPYFFDHVYAVTCWRKDARFHKEVIEYTSAEGTTVRSPHMDIEPVTDSVIFRWHKHQFPTDFSIEKPTVVTIRVILDWKVLFESYVMIEKAP